MKAYIKIIGILIGLLALFGVFRNPAPDIPAMFPDRGNSTAEESVPVPKKDSHTSIPTDGLYSVIKVIDGDTVSISSKGTRETVRLIGINTPETVDPRKPVECFGMTASNEAKTLLSGKQVRIEKDPTQGERDKYGRLLAYIFLEDGTSYNKYMIEKGYAYEYTYRSAYKYQTEFKEAQAYAKEHALGLWNPTACPIQTNAHSVGENKIHIFSTSEKNSVRVSV